MTLKELAVLQSTLVELQAFAEGNTDGDESGIYQEMMIEYSVAMKIVKAEQFKIYLRNAKAKILRTKT